jgi:transposase
MESGAVGSSEAGGGRREKRRRRTKLERRRIVEETLKPGASVARVARAHGVNANQVFRWRKLYERGLLEVEHERAELLPVKIVEARASEARPAHRRLARAAGQEGWGESGTIHLQVGQAQLRIDGRADAGTLRAVLEWLRR